MRIDKTMPKIDFFRGLLEEARAASEKIYQNLEQNLAQYKGDKRIDGSYEDAKVVRNITYELIESQVTGYLPTPAVTPKMQSERNDRNAKSIETLLCNKRVELPFEKLNDIDERFNPIYGGSVWLIEWDDSIVTHNSAGDIKLSCLSPQKFIGQPNIFEIDDMDYCFVSFETTREDLVRKYDVSLSAAEEADSEYADDDKTATVYVCYYRSERERICQYIWSGETELLDINDYFSRKRRVCRLCGRREELCSCETPELVSESDEYEILNTPIVRSDGSIIPSVSPIIRDGSFVYEAAAEQVFDGRGEMVFDDAGGNVSPLFAETKTPKTEPTKLPFYLPNKFPIVIRKNTSQENSLFGQSDCEFIRPQQQEINKIESRISQKLMRSCVLPLVSEDFEGSIDNSIYENVIRVKPGQGTDFGRIDMQVDISRDIAYADRLYDHAKRILGITDSFQGQYDPSAQSGRAKQIQVQQAAGRLDSKRKMKNAAYAEIDRIIFQLFLAYADEPRPATCRDAQGRLQNRMFNRYDFIEYDTATGEYYYNDQYLFRTDSSVDFEKSKELMWQENRQNFQSGAYGDPSLPQTRLIFWQNMERSHYPFAQDNVERIKAEIEEQAQIAQMQEQINRLNGQLDSQAAHETNLINSLKGAGA